MQNSTRVISSSKYQLIENRLRECFSKNESHSRVIDSTETQSGELFYSYVPTVFIMPTIVM